MVRFCEYQIALVAVGKTRKRLKFVHFTTIIALVAVGNQGKEYRKINDLQIVGLHREGNTETYGIVASDGAKHDCGCVEAAEICIIIASHKL